MGVRVLYFGARYYNSDISVWLSVDPMSDFRQGLSPYNYVQWNPSNRIDPSGMLDFKGGPGKKGKRPKNRRFRMNNRKFTGRNLRWKGSRGTSSPPVTKLNRLSRNLGLTNRIATVPMGRYRTSQWTNVDGTGSNGTSVFSYSPNNRSSYRLRSIRVRGTSTGSFTAFSISGGPHVVDGAYGRFMDAIINSSTRRFDSQIFGIGGSASFIPLINNYLGTKAFSSYSNGEMGNFAKYALLAILNNARTTPTNRNFTNFRIDLYSSGNASYNVQIRFRQWQQIDIVDRFFLIRWFYLGRQNQ